MKKPSLSTRHEAVDHAALGCQAAVLPLTPQCLRGLKQLCPMKRQKTGGFASHVSDGVVVSSASWSGGSLRMPTLGFQKGRSLRGFLLVPQREQDSHPDVGQRSDGHTMALALLAFAIVVVPSPGFPARVLGPRKLVQGVAQWLATVKALMDRRVVAALKGHRRGASQGLNTGRIAIALPVVSPLGRTIAEPSACLLQGDSQRAYCQHGSKKGVDLLVVSSDLLDRGGLSCFLGGGGLQKAQGGFLLERAREQLHSDRVVGYASGDQLIGQEGLHLDQTILVPRQGFEFGDRGTSGVQSAQVGQLRTAMLGQHIDIDQIGLRSRSRAFAVNGFGVDRIERYSCLQQSRDEQTMRGFVKTGNLFEWSNRSQETDQFGESVKGVLHPQRGNSATGFVDHHDVMMPVSPVDQSLPQKAILSWQDRPGACLSFYLTADRASFQSSLESRNTEGEAESLFIGRARWRICTFTFRSISSWVYPLAATLSKRAWF